MQTSNSWALPPLRAPDWASFMQAKIDAAETEKKQLKDTERQPARLKILGMLASLVASAAIIVFVCLGAIALPALSGLAISIFIGAYICFQYRKLQVYLATPKLSWKELTKMQSIAAHFLDIPALPHPLEEELLWWEQQHGTLHSEEHGDTLGSSTPYSEFRKNTTFTILRNKFTKEDCWELAQGYYARFESNSIQDEVYASRLKMNQYMQLKDLNLYTDKI